MCVGRVCVSVGGNAGLFGECVSVLVWMFWCVGVLVCWCVGCGVLVCGVLVCGVWWVGCVVLLLITQ